MTFALFHIACNTLMPVTSIQISDSTKYFFLFRRKIFWRFFFHREISPNQTFASEIFRCNSNCDRYFGFVYLGKPGKHSVNLTIIKVYLPPDIFTRRLDLPFHKGRFPNVILYYVPEEIISLARRYCCKQGLCSSCQKGSQSPKGNIYYYHLPIIV